jgi:hypothetical protein
MDSQAEGKSWHVTGETPPATEEGDQEGKAKRGIGLGGQSRPQAAG